MTALEMIETRIEMSGGNPYNYDTDAMVIDFNNSNLNLDTADIEEYNTFMIVTNSIINGQFKQAKEQANQFHVDYNMAYFSIKGTDPSSD